MGAEGGLRRRVKGLSEAAFRQRYGTEEACRAALLELGWAPPAWRARGGPPARRRPWPAHHGARAHAERAPPACRVDDRADRTHGGQASARAPPSSPASSWKAGRIPSRATAPVSAFCVWRASTAPSASRRRATAGSISAPAPMGRNPVDPQARPRPATATAKPTSRAGAARPRQSSRLPLLPLRKRYVADLPHPRPAAAVGARRCGEEMVVSNRPITEVHLSWLGKTLPRPALARSSVGQPG